MMSSLSGIFELPESTEDLQAWLEELFCNNDFSSVINDLLALQNVSDEKADPPKFEDGDRTNLELSSEKKSSILENGLSCLDRHDLQGLLANPRQLVELQGFVIRNGGPYWRRKFDSAYPDIRPFESMPVPDQGPIVKGRVTNASSRTDASRKLSFGPFAVLTALAASVLIFLGGFWTGLSRPGSSVAIAPIDPVDEHVKISDVWGWNRPNAFAVDLGREGKLTHVANLLSEWNLEVPNNATELLARTKDLRDSCDQLLDADLADLPEDDVVWLKEKCEAWSTKIDAQIAKLKNPGENVDSIRSELNKIVHKAVFVIRSRSRQS